MAHQGTFIVTCVVVRRFERGGGGRAGEVGVENRINNFDVIIVVCTNQRRRKIGKEAQHADNSVIDNYLQIA